MHPGVGDEALIDIREAGKSDSSRVLFQALLVFVLVNPLNAELNPICHLPALLAHHIFHVSGLRVNMLVRYVNFTL